GGWKGGGGGGGGVRRGGGTMVEDMISGQGLARRAAGHTTDGGPMEAAEVFEAGRDVPGLDHLLTEFVAELAFHVVNLAICIDPGRVAGGGGVVPSSDRRPPGLQGAPPPAVPDPPETAA